jgi:hypothetical protein
MTMANSTKNSNNRVKDTKSLAAVVDDASKNIASHSDSETPEQVDAVIIRVVRQPNGSIVTLISTNGDIRITEIESILRVAKEHFLDNARK